MDLRIYERTLVLSGKKDSSKGLGGLDQGGVELSLYHPSYSLITASLSTHCPQLPTVTVWTKKE